MRIGLLGTYSAPSSTALVARPPVELPAVPDAFLMPEPADRHPAAVYLASLAPGSRRTMRQALDAIANVLAPGADSVTLPWHRLGYQHVAAVRARLAAEHAPTTANKMMAALRGVVRQAFALGLIDAEASARIVAVKAVRGSRAPKGRAVSHAELASLFESCNTSTPGGARDAALLGVAYGAGLRRSEVVGLDLADYDRQSGVLRIKGKGNKERRAYVTNGSRTALDAWIAVRGEAAGPLFMPVTRGGRVVGRRMTDQAVYMLFRRLARRADVEQFSPHDLRRTFIGDLLDAGVDIVTVQALAAHASVATTARYDRRGERTRRRAAEMVSVPFGSSYG